MFYKYYLYTPLETAMSGVVLYTMSLYRFTHISPLQITSTSRFPEMLYHNSNALHHKVGCYFGVSIYGFFKGTALGTVSAGAIIAAEYFTTGKDLFKLPETIEENFQDSVIAAISIAPIVGSIMMLSSIPRFQYIPVENLPTGIMFPEAEIFRPHDNTVITYAKIGVCFAMVGAISSVPAIIISTAVAGIESNNISFDHNDQHNITNSNTTILGEIYYAME